MPEMNDQERCLMELGETLNTMGLYIKNNDGNKRLESQQDRLHKSNQGSLQSTEENGNSSTVDTSAENGTFYVSPAFWLRPLQLENHLGVGISTCPTGFTPCDSYSEEDTGNCSTATFFSEPVYVSNFGANQSNYMKSNAYDHEVYTTSSLIEQNEMNTFSSFTNGASDGMWDMEYGSTSGVINSDTRCNSNAYMTESFEGSRNCFHIDNPATTCSVENWGYFLRKRAKEVNTIENSDEWKTQNVPKRSSQVPDSERADQKDKNDTFLVPANDTENVAGASRANARAQWYLEDESFICTECGKNFVCENDVVVHYRVHVRDRPFICDSCGKRYLQKCHLTTHLRTHTGEKPYSCDKCEYKSNQIGHLNLHRLSHTGEKPHKCCICGKRFLHKNNLNSHLRTHTGEQPYKCGICGKTFSCINNCKRHRRMCEEKK